MLLNRLDGNAALRYCPSVICVDQRTFPGRRIRTGGSLCLWKDVYVGIIGAWIFVYEDV